MKILIAGIGNIFFGDDAFGVEVAQRLMRRSWPEGVLVKDFGIRGLDLAYALLEDYDAFVLIDAVSRGEAAGTLYRMEIDPASIETADGLAFDAHTLHPLRVLQAVKAIGGSPRRVSLVGCEPGTADGMGLSAVVQGSLEEAVGMVGSLVNGMIEEARNERQEAFEGTGDHSYRRAGGYDAAGH